MAIVASTFVGAVGTLFLALCGGWWTSVYTEDPDIARETAKLMPVACLFLISDGLNAVLGAILRGLGRQQASANIYMFGFYLCAVPIAIYLGYGMHMQAVGLWYGLPDQDAAEPLATDSLIADLAHTQLSLDDHATPGPSSGLSPSATSMLHVLLPSLTKLDQMLESVWAKQDTLNEVLNRLAAELEQFDELVLPPGVSQHALMQGASERSPSTMGQQAAGRLRDSRAKIITINATLKKVRTRLDNVSMLAQAKILQNQQSPSAPNDM
ncbi:hypothetical protein GGH14_006108 [Coemansia sp. RSA 370]|nr:hypothetical protein GGH14_006108 [Coemansia sp. RSA 370]